jgi:hypothetical protein
LIVIIILKTMRDSNYPSNQKRSSEIDETTYPTA